MPVTGARSELDLAAATRAEIERVRASGVLGRSGRLLELFDYLVARSGDADPPKEIEIALAVFGKSDAEAVKDDPVARVYVHRLRRRLEDFYLRDGVPGGVRLELPKGDYRISGREVGREAEAAETSPPRRFATLWSDRRLVAALAAALVIANVAAWAGLAAGRGGETERLRRDPVWSALVDNDRPLMIVVGDYYMFGEYDDGMFLNRLVRDFAINSREDLLASQRNMPEEAASYVDVDVKYLPIGTAYALMRIMRVLPDDREARVTLASELSPEMMRDYDLIYVGLVSGLGALREPAFAASRFSVGASYDELVDSSTGRRYESEAFIAGSYGGMYRDYGLVARFPGPRGNAVLILAGARDAALTGIAETLTRPSGLSELRARAGAASSLEALYEIQGQGHVSLESGVVAAAPRDGAKAWLTLDDPLEFPLE
jgi:hypothetical protein